MKRRLVLATTALATLVIVARQVSLPPVEPLPSFASVRASWCPSDLRVLDRRREIVHELRVDPHGRRLAWTALADVSPALVGAIVASEDRRFREHGGADWRAFASAAWQRLTGGPSRGASTIPMQLAALVDPSLRRGAAPRSLLQKWRQVQAARELERRWTKDEILEAYLNLVTFRGEAQGLLAASEAFFGKDPAGLTTHESVALAASIRSPNATFPALLGRARALASIAPRVSGDSGAQPASDAVDTLEVAVATLAGAPDAAGPRATLAPHAARRLAASAAPCTDLPSTLDARLQAFAADALRRHLLALADRSAADGAVLVVDNARGEVLAYVGSSGSLSASRDVDGVQARRQAGSTLKPFLYAEAIERSLVTPATLVEDAPLEVASDGRIYRPENYDHRFRGLVSVRTALASSLNVPAVRTLLLVGADSFAATLRDLGMGGVAEDGDWYGPSLALGSADVSLWELVGAYRALAQGGTWSPLTWSPPERSSVGRGEAMAAAASSAGAGDEAANFSASDMREPGPEADVSAGRKVFAPATAHLVADVLSDRGSRASTFDLGGPLATRYWSAVKTGTSKDMRDNWCVGFSRRFTVGVWVGNFSGAPMHDVSGVSGAAPVWREILDALHATDALPAGLPGEAPQAPSGVVRSWTTFANDAEPARDELYVRGTEPVSGAAGLGSPARIVEPSDGAVIAIDPDIAPSRQRVAFVAHAHEAGAIWRLDGRPFGTPGGTLLWPPIAGRHELELVDRDGRTLDRAHFLVKGTVTPGQPAVSF